MLGVIAKVREMSLEVELRYKDVQERYRTLAMYSIKVRVMLCTYVYVHIYMCVCTYTVRIIAPKLRTYDVIICSYVRTYVCTYTCSICVKYM